jgi:hypothetical protein
MNQYRVDRGCEGAKYIFAQAVEVHHGALLFYDDHGQLRRAFAAKDWTGLTRTQRNVEGT